MLIMITKILLKDFKIKPVNSETKSASCANILSVVDSRSSAGDPRTFKKFVFGDTK